jgi:hypothetical protein
VVGRGAAKQCLTRKRPARSADAPPEIQPPPGTGDVAQGGREGRGGKGRGGEETNVGMGGVGKSPLPADGKRAVSHSSLMCILDFLPGGFFFLGAWGT